MTDLQLGRTREDVAYILWFCSAALVVCDPTVLDEFTVWVRDLLAPLGVPAATIRVLYEAIADALGGGFPATTAMLSAAAKLL